jgi:hypothetical protein
MHSIEYLTIRERESQGEQELLRITPGIQPIEHKDEKIEMTTEFIINHLWQSSMLRGLSRGAGVAASQEFAEGALLGLAERVAEISNTVRIAGEPRKCGSAASSTRRIGYGSVHPRKL